MREHDWPKVEQVLLAANLSTSPAPMLLSLTSYSNHPSKSKSKSNNKSGSKIGTGTEREIETDTDGESEAEAVILLPPSVHPAAGPEILVVQNQLEIRAAIVQVHKALKEGWAYCSNGIVDITLLRNQELIAAVERCRKSVVDTADTGGSNSPAESGHAHAHAHGQEESKGVGIVNTQSHSHTHSKTRAQEQIELLLYSSDVVIDARTALLKGELQKAGVFSNDGRSSKLHPGTSLTIVGL